MDWGEGLGVTPISRAFDMVDGRYDSVIMIVIKADYYNIEMCMIQCTDLAKPKSRAPGSG